MEIAISIIKELAYMICIIGATINVQILLKRYRKFKKREQKSKKCKCKDVNQCDTWCMSKQRFYENPPD